MLIHPVTFSNTSHTIPAVDPPTNVRLITNSSRSVTVLWDAPEGEVDSYKVTWSPEDGTVEYSQEDPTVAYLVDLEPCTIYSVSVTAVVNDTESEPSEEQQEETDTEGNLLPILKNKLHLISLPLPSFVYFYFKWSMN